MKLFIFRPKQYGPQTYIVMSESEDKARILAFDEMIKNDDIKITYGETLEFKVEVYEENQVATNSNG